MTATAHVKTQDKRIEQVFGEIETAFPFNVILKVPVPIARFSQFYSIMCQVERRQPLVGSDGRQSRTLFHCMVDGAVLVSGAV